MEINYSNKSDPNFRTAALWACDNNNNYYLLHSGEIGGGKEGINKETFWNNYDGQVEEVDLLQRVKPYFVITSLNDRNFVKNIAEFVKEVDRIKSTHNKLAKVKRHENQKNISKSFLV